MQTLPTALADCSRLLGLSGDADLAWVLSESALRRWVKQDEIDHGNNPTGALTTEEHEELRTLRREVRVLREERTIVKKAAAFFAKEQA